MQLSFVSVAVAAVAAVATAAPTTVTARQQFTAGVTFTGVDGTTFGQAFPEDGQSYLITNTLNVSEITTRADPVTCTFHGADGTETVLFGAGTVSVDPPQPQTVGSCQQSS